MSYGQQQQQQVSGPSPAAAMNVLGLLIRTWATSVEVLLHKRFGDRYFGVQAAAVLLLIPIYSLFWQGHDVLPLMCFMLVYLGAVMVARLDIVSRKRNGARIHSFYGGFPWYINARTKLSELQCKKYFEPLYVAAAGLGLYLLGEQPLGVYFVIAGACLFLSVAISDLEFERRAAAMNDQVIEQEYVAERFREMHDGRF